MLMRRKAKPGRERSRRSGIDPLQYRKTKREAEMEMKKGIDHRRQQLSMEQKREMRPRKGDKHKCKTSFPFNKGICSSRCKLRPSSRLSLRLCWPRWTSLDCITCL